jgi:predicted small metal-binding protein
MYEFQCGRPVCHSRITSRDKDELTRQVRESVRTAHRIDVPSAAILGDLESSAATELAPTRAAG